MAKKKLLLDDLAVEAFSTTAGAYGPRGTVRGHDGTEMTVCVGLCGGHEDSQYLGCNQPTQLGECQYPSTSCEPGETVDQYSCHCQYAITDARACCSGAGCSGMC